MINPATPQDSHVEGPTTSRGSSIKAIIFGLLADIGGTAVAQSLLYLAYGFTLISLGATPDQLAASLEEIPVDSWLSLTAIAIGTIFSVLGGYVCARIAKHNEYWLGGVLAVISTVASIAVVEIASLSYSALVTIALAIVGIVAVMLGAHLGVMRNRATKVPAE